MYVHVYNDMLSKHWLSRNASYHSNCVFHVCICMHDRTNWMAAKLPEDFMTSVTIAAAGAGGPLAVSAELTSRWPNGCKVLERKYLLNNELHAWVTLKDSKDTDGLHVFFKGLGDEGTNFFSQDYTLIFNGWCSLSCQLLPTLTLVLLGLTGSCWVLLFIKLLFCGAGQ